SGQDSHGMYSSRQGMSYGGGSYGGSDAGGMYSSSYGGDYVSIMEIGPATRALRDHILKST
ncbi:RNA recognition motif, partial [Trifolium medium]|nr:RNA recognition motif [Trifolium medium]